MKRLHPHSAFDETESRNASDQRSPADLDSADAAGRLHPALQLQEERRVDDEVGEAALGPRPAKRAFLVPAAPSASPPAAFSSSFQQQPQEHHHHAVEDHYDRLSSAKPQTQVGERDPIFKFNNWVKSVLLGRFTPRDAAVLDLCCGAGGDLGKHAKNGVSVWCGSDIARVSLEKAVERFPILEKRGDRFPGGVCLIKADLCQVLIDAFIPLPKELTFEVVSCQFALHYAFESESKLRTMLQNSSCRVADGAFWVGTTTDLRELLWRLAQSPHLRFGNAKYSVEFFDESLKPSSATEEDVRKVAEQTIGASPFGRRYRFFLDGAIEHLDEFCVSMQVLRRYAGEYGWELVESLNFGEFWQRYSRVPSGFHLAQRMLFKGSVPPVDAAAQWRLFAERPNLTEDEWAVPTLYRTFVFRKTGASVQACVRKSAIVEPGRWQPATGPGSPVVVSKSSIISADP